MKRKQEERIRYAKDTVTTLSNEPNYGTQSNWDFEIGTIDVTKTLIRFILLCLILHLVESIKWDYYLHKNYLYFNKHNPVHHVLIFWIIINFCVSLCFGTYVTLYVYGIDIYICVHTYKILWLIYGLLSNGSLCLIFGKGSFIEWGSHKFC